MEEGRLLRYDDGRQNGSTFRPSSFIHRPSSCFRPLISDQDIQATTYFFYPFLTGKTIIVFMPPLIYVATI